MVDSNNDGLLYSSDHITVEPSTLSLDDKLLHPYPSTSYLSTSSPKSSRRESSSISSFSKTTDGRKEWLFKQKKLQDELLGVQEECRRLRVQVEQRTNKLTEDERPLSSLSYRGNPLIRHTPLIKNSLLTSSNTSLSSIKSQHTNNATTTSSQPLKNTSFSSAYSSTLLEGPHTTTTTSNSVLLEKAKIKIRKLEKELSIVEGQLANKTKQSVTHVEELTQLRSLLSHEKTSHSISLHQSQEKAANELGRIKGLHSTQINEMENTIKHLKTQHINNEQYSTKLKTELKGSQSEVKVLKDNISKLVKQLEEERESHKLSMERVQSEVIDGQKKVTELKKDLKSYQQQLNHCMTDIQFDKNDKEREITQLQQEVILLTNQLHECKDELIKGNHTIRSLQEQFDTTNEQLHYKDRDIQRINDKYTKQLEECESIKRNLVNKLERANKELTIANDRILTLQQSSLTVHTLEGEMSHLKQYLTEQQEQRHDSERQNELIEKELNKIKSERSDLITRLQQCTQQLSQMQQRSEEWRNERDRLNIKLKEMNNLLMSKEREIQSLNDTIKNNKLTDSQTNDMQNELNKRSQQVMQLDTALRKHQAETATKTLQLERTLASKQSDLKTRTHEMEQLSKRYAQANKTISQLQEQLNNKPRKSDGELLLLKEQLEQLKSTNSTLQNKLHVTEGITMESLKQEIVQLETQHKTSQEEVARCRAQVASLSAELSVERQLLEETRDELIKTKTLSTTSSLPSTSSLFPVSTSTSSLLPVPPTTVRPVTIPTLSFEDTMGTQGERGTGRESDVSEVEYHKLPTTRYTKQIPLRSSTNIINI